MNRALQSLAETPSCAFRYLQAHPRILHPNSQHGNYEKYGGANFSEGSRFGKHAAKSGLLKQAKKICLYL